MTVVMSVHDPTHSDSVNPYQILGGKGKVIKLQLVFRCMVTTTVMVSYCWILVITAQWACSLTYGIQVIRLFIILILAPPRKMTNLPPHYLRRNLVLVPNPTIYSKVKMVAIPSNVGHHSIRLTCLVPISDIDDQST